jgi:hypothetical protein
MKPIVCRLAPLAATACALLTLSLPAVSAASGAPEKIRLRIEGATSTIFAGTIKTEGHEVTTASGGTHKCDGTNLGANAEPGPTPTSAVDSAAAKKGFTWDTAGVTTNTQGEATLTFAHPGNYRVKASRPDSIRSNSLVLKAS